jgi:hypothetical protein
METLLIELTHPKALDLLRDLEEMQILKVLPQNEHKEPVRNRVPGGLKHLGLKIPDDFNEPLDDLKDYMF